jgi:YesN/AraC family two-component response regulator
VFINILNGIYQISKTKSPIEILSIHGRFLCFLSAIYNNRRQNIYMPESLNPTVSKIYSIASYIHSHYDEELTLESLSRKFYLSSFYLSHLFKDITGFTLIHYIQMTRIRNAQQLLLFTDKKITDIAEECGFTSFSQFNRVFNKFCGTSPSKYKKQSGILYPESDTIPITYTRD